MRIALPATEPEILAFERRYGIRVDPEFRAYLLTVNGMLQSTGTLTCSRFGSWTESAPLLRSVLNC